MTLWLVVQCLNHLHHRITQSTSGEQKFLLPPWEFNYNPLVLQPITYHYSDNANIFVIFIEMFESMHICSIARTV
jgi:hypothetical protein